MLNKKACCYLITNIINNRQYVGVTTNFKQRMYGHKYAPNKKLKPDITLYGWDTFTKVIIFEDTEEECYNKEDYYINKYNCYYNINIGGYGNAGINGEDNGNSTMTDTSVLHMRNYFSKNSTLSFESLGKLYGISQAQAIKIIHGEYWKHVGGPIVIERLNKSNAKNKITSKQVKVMRETYYKGGVTMKSLGIPYGLSQQQCSRIITGKKWKEAAGPIKGVDYGR